MYKAEVYNIWVLVSTLNLLAAVFVPHLHIRTTVWQSAPQDQLQVLKTEQLLVKLASWTLRIVTDLVTGVELRTKVVLQVIVDLLISSEQRGCRPQFLNV